MMVVLQILLRIAFTGDLQALCFVESEVGFLYQPISIGEAA